MQRPRIAANEQPAALDERPQLCEIELTDIQHPSAAGPSDCRAAGRDPCRRHPIGRSRAQHDPPGRGRRRQPGNQRVNAASGHRRNGLPALT